MLSSTLPIMLSPNDLARYAEFHGWARGAPYGEDSNVYVSRRGEMIILPSNIDADDYQSLADQAVRALADLSDIDLRTIYDDIRRFDRDTIRIRAINSDTQNGSIELKDGKVLIDNTWDVLNVVASDVKKSAGLEAQETESLLEGFRLEQTEVTSYALTVTTPPVPIAHEGQMLHSPQRHVTERMANALRATRQLADARRNGSTELASHKVLSAEWCKGLVFMVDPFAEVEFGLTWARTAPLQQVETTTFSKPDDMPFLMELADRLLPDDATEEFHNVNIAGYVEVLKHPKPANSQRTVTIKAAFNAKNITISAVLNPDDYSRACRANESKSNVVVSGSRLIKNARSWELEDARIEDVIAPINPLPASKDQSRMALST